jgi:hypothetical protein
MKLFGCRSPKQQKEEDLDEANRHIIGISQQETYDELSDTSSSSRRVSADDLPKIARRFSQKLFGTNTVENSSTSSSSNNHNYNNSLTVPEVERSRAVSNPLPSTTSGNTTSRTAVKHASRSSITLVPLTDREKKKIYTGKLKTIRNIADGGFSRVYEVEGIDGSPLVGRMAMKELILASSSIEDNNSSVNRRLTSDKIQLSLSKRINDEISMFQKLSTHDNIVTYLDSYIDEDTHTVYILQELCDMNLKNCILNQMNKISDTMILEWCRTLARVLDYVHSQGIIHRDIKPANILFKKEKVDNRYMLVLKLCDFGLSKVCSCFPCVSLHLTNFHFL